MKRLDWKKLLICLAIPLAVGGLAGILIQPDIPMYAAVKKPPLSPPGVVFPIVWTLLYMLMGISSYLILEADAKAKPRARALTVYGAQLIVNFAWPLLFFSAGAYLPAFLLLVFLWALVAYMAVLFWRIRKTAAWLQAPYLIWLTFAGYLNLGVYLLNG